MKAIATPLQGVFVIEPKVFGDARGFFFESWNQRAFDDAIGREARFVQDNHSASMRHVLRGMHYQLTRPQGKLVRVVEGEVFDVAVDMRRSSPTFGRWFGEHLSAENRRMMWVPEGFAHGFLVTSERAEFVYKTTEYYVPEDERTLRWDDADLGIAWPLDGAPLLKAKDTQGTPFAAAETFA
jgi:dTDP-4-dehydrorhamnose 3,5-epimerase